MYTDTNTYLAKAVVTEICERSANIFGNENPRFDRARFLKACGVES
jgi:hypothetical protein